MADETLPEGTSRVETVRSLAAEAKAVDTPARIRTIEIRDRSAIKVPLLSSQRTVSPPPPRRTQPASGPDASATVRPQIVNEPPTTVVTKAPTQESLNPRLLQRPPASHPFRFTVVRKLHDELVRLNEELLNKPEPKSTAAALSKQELITLALDEEEKVALEQPVVYSNVIKHRIMAFKKMKLEGWKGLLKARKQQDTPSGGANASTRRDPPCIDTGLTPEEELAILPRLEADLEGLEKHGYILTRPTEAEVVEAQRGVAAARGFEECDRCKTRFQVFPGRREEDGALASGGRCTYHHGKAVMPPKKGDDAVKGHVDKRFACCNQPIGQSAGCVKADTHVFKVTEPKRLACVLQFEEASAGVEKGAEALCLDCEMCYTVHGLELVRMTATAWPGREEVLDVLVRPIGEILDLNSRFSGVWPEQLTSPSSALPVLASPSAARALLFTHLSRRTYLVGHGLENDLAATRIIHRRLVDSALLFRHPRGLPFRLGLKALTSRHLERDIQVVVEGGERAQGHDSKEDARAAGDLVRWKVGEAWRGLRREGGWRVHGGRLVREGAPGV
ncbi:MAG: RNA exonuclease 3 [Thelocarpon impressellum]|nr:MAG: RNA exonuclease 3 [Thelocarpon impressellum]